MPVLQPLGAGSGEAPKQYNQSSRKGKKAWRKNVDVTEVEVGLQELNEEIIRGGAIREKDSAELFTIDIAGDSKISKKYSKHVKKSLKADEIIAQRSVVPAVSMRKRPGDKTADGVIAAKRQRTDWVSHKELARLKNVADGHHGIIVETRAATYDLWNASMRSEELETKDIEQFLHLRDQAKVPKSMKQKPISLSASGKPVPAVQKPSGGYSYNPTFTDYEERLAGESAKAIEIEQKRLEFESAEKQKQEAAARSAAEAEAAEERANMSEWEEDSEWEGFQSGAEDNRPSMRSLKRKTQAQRNRIKRRKENEQLSKHKTAMKARRVQEQRIQEIANEVAERESNKVMAVVELSDTSIEEHGEKLRKKQLGKFKLPERDLELVLPDELQESLRLLKPEGNLLKDRYRSFLVRGKMESRRHLPFKRQARKKVTEKWAHKDFIL